MIADYKDTVWYRGSRSGHYRDFKCIDGNEHDEFGPGLYYTDSYEIASRYGEVKSFTVDTTKGFYVKGDPIDKTCLETIIGYADSEHLEISLSNWDENPDIAYFKLLKSILRSKDMPDAIVSLFIDVFRKDREDFWLSCKAAGVYGLIYDDPYNCGSSCSFLVLFNPKKVMCLID